MLQYEQGLATDAQSEPLFYCALNRRRTADIPCAVIGSATEGRTNGRSQPFISMELTEGKCSRLPVHHNVWMVSCRLVVRPIRTQLSADHA